MFGVSITCLVVGFGIAAYSAMRFLPPLASTREGVIAAWVVRALLGSATAWAALQIYFAAYIFVNDRRRPDVLPVGGIDHTEVLTATVQSILTLSGLLTVGAVVVYLLAPTSAGEPAPD